MQGSSTVFLKDSFGRSNRPQIYHIFLTEVSAGFTSVSQTYKRTNQERF